VWLWPKVGIELDHKPGVGSRAAIVWNDGETIEIWNTFGLVQRIDLSRWPPSGQQHPLGIYPPKDRVRFDQAANAD
jgi:hypothetical protein